MSINFIQGYNLDNLEANFREFLISEAVSPITLKNYLSDLRHFLGWYSFHLSSKSIIVSSEQNNSLHEYLSHLNLSLVLDYRKYLETNNVPTKSINRRLSTLRKFCTFCISQGWLKTNPAKEISNNSIRNKEGISFTPSVQVVEEHTDNPKMHSFQFGNILSEYINTLPQADGSSSVKDLEEVFFITNLHNFFNE
jgi:site-specific recombinase XerD